MSKFYVGDVVVQISVTSARMPMTVETVDVDRIGCSWFVGDELYRSSFLVHELELHEP